VLDRETLLGIAVFDGRVTGEPLVNSELQLIFHLLEQLALAVKNIWLHDQLASNHAMMAEILRELSSACVVVSRDLTILHANKMARRYFLRGDSRGGELEFNDLPQALGAKIFQVLKTGSAISTFRYEPAEPPGAIYNVNIVPFQRPQPGLPASALMMVDDLTQSEQLRRLELEAANLRLVKTMADRLTHEMGNAMVRLSTYQQLLSEKLSRKVIDQEFLKVMERDWADDIKRVTRLVSQMRYLNVDSPASQEAFPLAPLLEEAYQEASKYLSAKPPKLTYDAGNTPIVISGDRAALKHALSEVMLNALQANPAEPKIGVRLHAESLGNGRPGLEIEVQDNGAGFSPEAAEKAFDPFYTTRNVGLGLGLTVSRKVIGSHRGKLEIIPAKPGSAGGVRIFLPLADQ
jgi:signal transduction histidine kinase